MSFTPTRHALIAEGASDAILLPSLLRQAGYEQRLGFQVAPGLSSVAAASVCDLEAEAGRVGFIVDGDRGGADIIDKLSNAGVPRGRVVVLTDGSRGQPLETEDLVDGETYARAVNDELHCWQTVSIDVTLADVGDTMRTKHLRAWCEAHGLDMPDKAAVAQRIVDASSEKSVFAADRQQFLRSLLTNIRAVLGLG
ncbi:MAG: hypothetical protein LC808_24935 [Actinobacteria bacterium]|nr:hypothetical protein [Actinomycetota bacterium]